MAITKVIHSETASYRPILTDTLVLDAVPTVNSFNSVTSDAVARAVAGASGEVPQVTENDNGKVLTAIYDEGGAAVEWGAVESGATYTAGDGIEIDAQNAVSVKAGNGLSFNSGSTVDMTLKAIKWNEKYYSIGLLTAQAVAAIKGNASLAVTVLSDYTFLPEAFYSFNDARIAIVPGQNKGTLPDISAAKAILSTTDIRSSFVRNSDASMYTMPANTQVTVDFSNPTVGSLISWADVEANPTNYLLAIVGNYYGVVYGAGKSYSEAAGSDPEQKDISTIEYTVAGDNSLQVSNPVPAHSAADAGKVLQVQNDGTLAWVTLT